MKKSTCLKAQEISFSHRRGSHATQGRCGSEAGFSLRELLVVVAIIAILAVLAIPSFLESKKAANEASAIAYVRTWSSAQEIFKSKHGRYASNNDELVGEKVVPPPPDSHGYVFELHGTNSFWWGVARPVAPGRSGVRSFYLDLTGMLRFTDGPLEEADSSASGSTGGPCAAFGLDPSSPACS